MVAIENEIGESSVQPSAINIQKESEVGEPSVPIVNDKTNDAESTSDSQTSDNNSTQFQNGQNLDDFLDEDEDIQVKRSIVFYFD